MIVSLIFKSHFVIPVLYCLQNKGKRGDNKESGADGVKEDLSSPDTGQQQSAGVARDTSSSADGAGAAVHANNSSSYNLVSSLLNLTKSPVSQPFIQSCVCLC